MSNNVSEVIQCPLCVLQFATGANYRVHFLAEHLTDTPDGGHIDHGPGFLHSTDSGTCPCNAIQVRPAVESRGQKIHLPSLCSGSHRRVVVVPVRFLGIFKKRVSVCMDCYLVRPYRKGSRYAQ
jgi:hypothetical protein